MYPSLIEIGSKMAEKNSAQTNRETDTTKTRMWANAQPDGRPAEHRWRSLFNAPKFG